MTTYASETLADNRGFTDDDLTALKESAERKLNSLNCMVDVLDGNETDPLTLSEFIQARRGTLKREPVAE